MRWSGQHLALVGVLGLGAGGFALLHATAPQPEAAAEAPRAVSLFVEPVRARNVALDVHTRGEVRAKAEMDLVAQVSGQVVSVAPEFVQGGSIEPGALLLQIDDTDYRYALVRAEAEIAEARMRVAQIEADAQVARRQLAGTRASALGLREPQLADAKAKLRAAEANLAQAEVALDRTRVTLPFRGRIRSTAVHVGQYVSAGTVLGSAFSTDVAEVRLPLTDQQLASLGLPIGYVAAPGQGALVEFSATVGGQERHWNGRLTRLDAAVDPDTRLLHAVAEVEKPYTAAAVGTGMPFAVGLFVNAQIHGRDVKRARVIPRIALRSGDSVYVVKDGLLSIRKVRVLHERDDELVLADGVEVGEAVVVSAVRSPVEGLRVHGVPRETRISGDTGRAPRTNPV